MPCISLIQPLPIKATTGNYMSYRRSESVLLHVVQEPVLSRQETSNSVVDCFFLNIVGQLSEVECSQMTRVHLLPLHACTVPILYISFVTALFFLLSSMNSAYCDLNFCFTLFYYWHDYRFIYMTMFFFCFAGITFIPSVMLYENYIQAEGPERETMLFLR